ncbi:GNAT family N-acetyltransferase [Bacillus cereus]
MNIKLAKTKLEEAEELLCIQKKAFQSDLEKYQDYDSSPATEKVERLMRKIELFHHFTIWINNEIVGGIDVRDLNNQHYRINRIFLKTSLQNKGLGSRIMNLIHQEFPEAEKWSLDTPKDNIRNHHFYEKCGYRVVGEHQINNKLILLDYEMSV